MDHILVVSVFFKKEKVWAKATNLSRHIWTNLTLVNWKELCLMNWYGWFLRAVRRHQFEHRFDQYFLQRNLEGGLNQKKKSQKNGHYTDNKIKELTYIQPSTSHPPPRSLQDYKIANFGIHYGLAYYAMRNHLISLLLDTIFFKKSNLLHLIWNINLNLRIHNFAWLAYIYPLNCGAVITCITITRMVEHTWSFPLTMVIADA